MKTDDEILLAIDNTEPIKSQPRNEKMPWDDPSDSEAERKSTSEYHPADGAGDQHIRARPFELRDPKSIPSRKWIYGRHFIRGFVTATAGTGGVGKSCIEITEAIAIATGRDLLGEPVVESCPVWYINLEDPQDEIDRRITAACLHHKIDRDALDGRLFVNSGRDARLVIAREDSIGSIIVTPVIEAFKKAIVTNDIGVVIIDPFVKVHRIPENANEKIDEIVTELARISAETKCCIDLVQHLRKGSGERSSDDIRGASSFVAAVRSTRIVNVMTENESKKAGIKDSRRLYLRVDDGKRNMAPPSDKTTWRKLESVDLGNVTGKRPSDKVGVATSWSWPDPFDNVSVHDLKDVQRRVAAGNYRAHPSAKNWVGCIVAELLDLDIGDDADKAKIKGLIKTWIENGVLKKVDKTDKGRTIRPFIEVGKLV